MEDNDISTYGNFYCPFHSDSDGGHASGKYYDTSDTMFCYSERRTYTAFDAALLFNATYGEIYKWALSNGFKEFKENAQNEAGTANSKLDQFIFSIPPRDVLDFKLGKSTFNEFMAKVSSFYNTFSIKA